MSHHTAAAVAVQSPEASPSLPAIGTVINGGYFVGVISVNDKQFGLVMAGAVGELGGRWNKVTNDNVVGALPVSDGLANTQAMAAAGSPLAKAMLELSINGFSDWYIPSLDELELAYRHFKPSTTPNWAGDGINESSVPAGDAYSRTSPAQTTVAALIEGEPDALVPAWYWSSTQYASIPNDAWGQNFDDGYQYYYHKSYAGRARAFRRFEI